MRAELIERLERLRVALVDHPAGFLAGELNDGAGLRALGAGPPDWAEVLQRYDGGRVGVVEVWRVDELEHEQAVLASLPLPWCEGLCIGTVDGEPLVIDSETQQIAWFTERTADELPEDAERVGLDDGRRAVTIGSVEHLFSHFLLGDGYPALADDPEDAWAALLDQVP